MNRFCRTVLVGWCLLLLMAPAPAQNTQELATLSDLERAMSRYYETPADLAKLVAAWERSGAGVDSMMGFLAGVFVKHPDRIALAVNAQLYT